jgi:hypothetical protein
MSLAKRCAPGFGRRDWRRGADYFQSGAVSIFEQRSDGLRAKVQGSERSPYRVALDWSRARLNQLLVDCSCPRFDDVGLCKHVAATILAADDQNLGALIPGQGILLIAAANNDHATHDASDADEEDWSDEDDERDEDPSSLRGFDGGSVRRAGALLNGVPPGPVASGIRPGRIDWLRCPSPQLAITTIRHPAPELLGAGREKSGIC